MESPLDSDDDEEGMAKLADFLHHLGLEKYYNAFESKNINFNHLLQMSTEEMKKIVEWASDIYSLYHE